MSETWNTGDEQKDLLLRCGVALRQYELLLKKHAVEYPFGKEIEQKVDAIVKHGQQTTVTIHHRMEDEIKKAYREASRRTGSVYDHTKGRFGCLFFWTTQVYLEADTQADTWHWYDKNEGRVSRSFDLAKRDDMVSELKYLINRPRPDSERLNEVAETIIIGIASDSTDGYSTHEQTVERLVNCLRDLIAEYEKEGDPLKA